jgi:hypothetical protein
MGSRVTPRALAHTEQEERNRVRSTDSATPSQRGVAADFSA